MLDLGICTRYTQHESTFAAVRLADAATDFNMDVAILTMTDRPRNISPRWDRKLLRSSDVSFVDWAVACEHVLWTYVPHIEQMVWVRKQQKRTSILVMWHELAQVDCMVLSMATQLLCPSVACYDLLRSYGFRNCVCMPWDCGQPIFRKPDTYTIDSPKVLLPFWDGNPRRSEMTVVDIISSVLQQHSSVRITLAYNSSVMQPKAIKRIDAIARSHAGRLSLCRHVDPEVRFKLFQSHDITLYPSHFENTGATVIQSLEMGTPVIGFAFRPLTEILTPQNSIVIPCAEQTNDFGTPLVVPDYERLHEVLNHTLKNTDLIRNLQHTVSTQAEQRREQFIEIGRTALL